MVFSMRQEVPTHVYAPEVVNIVEAAGTNRIPIIAISGSTLPPLAKAARVLFAVPEHEYCWRIVSIRARKS